MNKIFINSISVHSAGFHIWWAGPGLGFSLCTETVVQSLKLTAPVSRLLSDGCST